MKDLNDVLREEGVDGVRARVDAAQPYKPNGNAGKQDWRAYTTTAAALHTMDFPPVSYVLPGFIPEGLSILAGRPKVGKSWLALELCLGVAGDCEILGGIRPSLGDVLYLALEDNLRRLRQRIRKIGTPWPERLTLATQWRRLDAGGVEDISEWAASVVCPRLVIMDTLAGVRPERQMRDTPYDGDYRALTEIHQLAGENQMSAIALHHTRKMDADDPIDTVSGTLGLAGAADTVLILTKTPQGPALYVRGRDIEEAEHALSFNKETCRWVVLGHASEVRVSDQRKAIVSALRTAGEPLGPSDIAAIVSAPTTNVKFLLHKMTENGEIVKVGRGRYQTPLTSLTR